MGEKIKFLPNYLAFEKIIIENDCSVNEFANKNKVKIDNIVFNNENLFKGEVVVIKHFKTHIVKPNETVELIAKLYNISQENLIKRNGISKLFVGQLLYIWITFTFTNINIY